MNMDGLPEIGEGSMLPPIKLTPQQEELCSRLDSLNQRTIQGQELSKMFRGAIYATREECRSNPDWMAQSAHSFREILYQFSPNYSEIKWFEAFKMYGSATADDDRFEQIVGTVQNKVTKVAHHAHVPTIEEYENLIDDFQRVLFWASTRQVDIHNQIDKYLSENKPEEGGK